MKARMTLLALIAFLAAPLRAVEFAPDMVVMNEEEDSTGMPACEEEPVLSETEDADAGCDPLYDEEPVDEKLIV